MARKGGIFATHAIILCPIVGLAVAMAGCTTGGDQRGDASMTDAPAEAYSGPCTFSAEAFDLSCTTDMDCLGVSPSYYCSPAQCGCSSIAISRGRLGASYGLAMQTTATSALPVWR